MKGNKRLLGVAVALIIAHSAPCMYRVAFQINFKRLASGLTLDGPYSDDSGNARQKGMLCIILVAPFLIHRSILKLC